MSTERWRPHATMSEMLSTRRLGARLPNSQRSASPLAHDEEEKPRHIAMKYAFSVMHALRFFKLAASLHALNRQSNRDCHTLSQVSITLLRTAEFRYGSEKRVSIHWLA